VTRGGGVRKAGPVGSSGDREHDDRDVDRGDRDRDDVGRARNARPRDALGRPLPRGSAGVPRQPEGVPRSPGATLAEAQRLLDEGLPFHAHEVFEDAWKASAEPDRALWKGLAQLAVGLTHAARGNPTGAVRLLRRGADHIEPYVPESPHDIDLDGLLRWARDYATTLEAGTGGVPMPRLRRF
jgi:uncharacterized protein